MMQRAYVNLFSPETWESFQKNGSQVTGFRERQRAVSSKIGPGDKFVCYLTGYSRWCGLLEINSKSFIDDTPIYGEPDPFVVRFEVRPEIVLQPINSIPISDPTLWANLSFTRDVEIGSSQWTGRVRSSLTLLDSADAAILEKALRMQSPRPKIFPFSEIEQRRVARKKTVSTLSGEVSVEVPDDKDDDNRKASKAESASIRESLQIQAKLVALGAKMGFAVWLPTTDRTAISDLIDTVSKEALLSRLPLNYDDATLRTIEQIDVIWLKGRAMARAFEVEHTTAIYSGILRMADLVALQPNINIRLHIVAPDERRGKVLQEIKRPVFSLLESGPLYDRCTFISYSALKELSAIPHVQHMKDGILDEFEEAADLSL